MSQIRRSVDRESVVLSLISRVDLARSRDFVDFRENHVGLAQVGILDSWVKIRCSSRMIVVNESE